MDYVLPKPVLWQMWIVWFFHVGVFHLVAAHRPNRPSAIIGGNPVEIDNVPYMARLWTKGKICGASIIDKWFILTAAHCIKKNLQYSVFVGGSKRIDKNSKKYEVDQIILHPRYSHISSGYDAALLRVSKPIIFSKYVQKIKLPYKNEILRNGDLLTATGWGRTETGNISDVLLIIKLPFVPRNICKHYFSNIKNTICAGIKGQSSCFGDSGGPLVYKHVQIGITSFGDKACGNAPTVFTKVNSIQYWISKMIRTAGFT